MSYFINTETGEIIKTFSLKLAQDYFKADGKRLGYKGKTIPFARADGNK